MTHLTISQLSTQVGLSPKTIRFYEEAGVISPPERSANGYRTYHASAVEELQLIKYVRNLGLPISEIKKLLKGCEVGNCEHSKNQVTESVTQYIQLITEKITQFTLLKSKLEKLNHSLHTNKDDCSDTKYCCNFLSQLVHIDSDRKEDHTMTTSGGCCGGECSC